MSSSDRPGGLRVAFRVSASVTARGYMSTADWYDQPTPPPGQEHRYMPSPERPWAQWPLPHMDLAEPQRRRIERARRPLTAVDLDPARCRFTYKRFTLVGTIDLPPGGYAYSPPREAWQAVDTVVMLAKWTAQALYGMRGPEHAPGGPLDGIALPDMTVSVRPLRARLSASRVVA
jgi:hypothetical protein